MFKKVIVTAICIMVLITIGYFLTIGVGKPISTDLSTIGQGKPTLVLAYENFSPSGGDALNRLRRIRSDYDLILDFVVADLGTPAGKAFASRHQLHDGQSILLKENGRPLSPIGMPPNEEALRERIEAALSAIE